MLRDFIKILNTQWTFDNFRNDRGFNKLMLTDNGCYRKDMRIVQNVLTEKKSLSKPFREVKFKFEYSAGYNHYFTISTRIPATGNKTGRFGWSAGREGKNSLRLWGGDAVEVDIEDVFSDPNDIQEDEILFFRTIYPELYSGIEQAIPRLAEGMRKVRPALAERFGLPSGWRYTEDPAWNFELPMVR